MSQATQIPDRSRESPEGPPGKVRGGRRGYRRFLAGGLAGLLLATGAFYLGQGSAGSAAFSAPIVRTSGKTGALDAAAIYKADAQGTTLVESRLSGGQGLFGLGGGQGMAGGGNRPRRTDAGSRRRRSVLVRPF